MTRIIQAAGFAIAAVGFLATIVAGIIGLMEWAQRSLGMPWPLIVPLALVGVLAFFVAYAALEPKADQP